ncbi:unnamed protein product [Acanthoscelides obtectus]|uniref:Uncharacterized protein n=1 Tax=Acanthoscelides obtectus TaxID=200917 RepID=A0A9P0PE26_ACAOB|nr:unnamed protein product [Acanthoscelides obtectus]CAK1635587.1 hypothetical protein AOBTE_LOCUS9370 [Acanthoscelides obtectus]
MISKSNGIPNYTEVIVISVIAICFLSLDVSVLTLEEDLQEIWNYDFDEKVKEEDVEDYLKYCLSGIVLLRAFTLHLFLALHFLLLWSAIGEEKPNLVVPWLLLGLFRSIFLNFLGFSTGIYVCLIQKGHHPVCLEYIIAQAIQHGPEVYAWLSIFRYHRALILSARNRLMVDERTRMKKIQNSQYKYFSRTNFADAVEDGRNVITESAIENVIHHIKRTKPTQCPSRSLDALIELKSAKIRKNDYELEGDHESIKEKVMRILNVVYEDIKKARIAKEKRPPWKFADLNIEKLLMTSERRHPNIYSHKKNNHTSSLEKKRTPSEESVYEGAIANEIELRCISLGGSNTSCFDLESKDNIHHARSKNVSRV